MGHMTAMAPTWSILVPTLGERRPLFERLMRGLLYQLDPYEGRVQVVAWYNDGSPPLPEIRHRLVNDCTSDYVSFVDDDDLVAPDFVQQVMTALDGRPDYVGFQVQCYSDGRPTGIAYHSLKYGRWTNERGRFFRDISHINPMRTSVARTADFRRARQGRAEDRIWVDQVRRSRLLRTEVVIDRILYHYLYSTSRTGGVGSRWERPHLITPGRTGRSALVHPQLIWSA